jgi:hypothetical protein
LFIVIWELRHGLGGGHQLVLERHRAEYISRRMSQDRPGAEIRVVTAEEHAAAVLERGRRRQSRA